MNYLAVLIAVSLLQAEPPQAADEAAGDRERVKKWMDFYAQRISEYEIFLDGDETRKLEFQKTSILQYTNPERTHGQHGAMFVWTRDGHPEAVGTIWSIRQGNDPTRRVTAHEFHSLSTGPLTSSRPQIIGRRGVVPQWTPRDPGIQWKPLPDAPDPADSDAQRLIQMRGLAREFEASSISRQDGKEQKLRLLPQPIYRYKSASSKVIEGGLFAFVMGTDPELLLMIEARPVNGVPRWHFAAARFTGIPLRLHQQGEVVWKCENAKAWTGDNPYFLCVGVRQFDAELEGEPESSR